MFDSAQSSILKVLRIPVQADEPFEAPSEIFQLSRHDQNNLDLKTHFELGSSNSVGEISMYMTAPATVQMLVVPKSDFMKDFYSRLKLSAPQANYKQGMAFDEQLSAFANQLEPAKIKSVGALFEELVRRSTHLHKKELRLIHSISSAQISQAGKLDELILEIGKVSCKAHQIRELCTEGRTISSDFEMLEDYVTHLMIDYLGHIRNEFDLVKKAAHSANSVEYRSRGKSFEEELAALIKKEVQYHQDHKSILHDENAREVHLVRINHLKKYFQSETFVDIQQKETIRQMSEPIAAGAAAFGAAWAGLFQLYYYTPQMAQVGLQGVMFLCVAVFLYVLRDRLKDVSRNFLTQKLGNILPELSLDLLLGKERIGEIKQYFWFWKKALPHDIEALRISKTASLATTEKHLQEHVICMKRQFELGAVVSKNCNWSLKETLRINMQRYLKYMDDPYKDIRVLNEHGELSTIRTHRVYYFYVLLKVELLSPKPWWARIFNSKIKSDKKAIYYDAFRVVIDKNGIDRVEPLGGLT